jgi:hypothetical protein
MPRQIVHGALSVLTLVVASSAWSAAAPWVPNTTGNVGPAPTTFNKWEAIEAPASSGASCGNGSPYRFFVNRTTNAANAKKTVIMFEGGGACWEQNACQMKGGLLGATNYNDQLKSYGDPNYCQRVTADDGALGEQHLRAFQDNEKTIPTVLTTSQKLSTGVDARNIRNIVLMRPINSMIEFKQIIGRGTRLYDGKDYFTIYDFVEAHHHFNDPEWDGEPVEPETCAVCGSYPCVCVKETPPCPVCGQKPCACPKLACPECGQQPCVCPKDPCPKCGQRPCKCVKRARIGNSTA